MQLFPRVDGFFECLLVHIYLENRVLDEISNPQKPVVIYQVLVLLGLVEFHQPSFFPIIIRPLHLLHMVIH